jgi:hypothetical protein
VNKNIIRPIGLLIYSCIAEVLKNLCAYLISIYKKEKKFHVFL